MASKCRPAVHFDVVLSYGNAIRNAIVVAEGPYDESLFRKELMASDIHWISGETPKFPLKCEARIRYRQPLQECVVECQMPNAECRVAFNEPQRAVTPGQSVVFYSGGEPFHPSTPLRAGSAQGRSLDTTRGREMLGGAIIA